MTQEIFSVFDSCAKRYLRPFVADSIDEALRSFRTICNDPEHQFAQYPTDYALFHIGSFDFETGKVTGLTEPHSLAMAAQMIDTTDRFRDVAMAGAVPGLVSPDQMEA